MSLSCASLADGSFRTQSSPVSVLNEAELSALVSGFLSDMNVGQLDIAVSYTYAATGETYSYNGDHWYDGAGLHNLPLMILFCSQKDSEAVKALNNSMGYETIINACLVNSSNRYSMCVQEYLYNSWKDYRQAELDLIGWNGPVSRYFTTASEYSSDMMNGFLYELVTNESKYKDVIDAMKNAQEGMYFDSGSASGKYEIAQKYGSDTDIVHCSGIIFTENPILITVMTTRIGDPYASTLLGRFADVLTQYTTETVDPAYKAVLDNYAAEQTAAAEAQARAEAEALEKEQQAQAEAQKAEEEKAQREAEEAEAQRKAAEEAEMKAAEEKAAQQTASPAVISSDKYLMYGAIAAAVVALILVIILIAGRKKRNYYDKYNEYDDEDYDEDDEEAEN